MSRAGEVCALLIGFALVACGSEGIAASVPPAEVRAATAEPAATPTVEVPSAEPETIEVDVAMANDDSEPNEDPDPMMTPANEQAEPDEPVIAEAQELHTDCLRLTEFALDAENFGWFIVNDNVMGGRSSGGPTFADSVMVFQGEINTDGGGFSSVRAEIAPTTLAGFTHLIVRARADDRTYKITLEDGLPGRDRRVSQQQTLVFGDPDDDGWQAARIDFDQLVPKIFGRDVESEAFRPDLATQLGIMISDGVDGPFRIEVDWIDACR